MLLCQPLAVLAFVVILLRDSNANAPAAAITCYTKFESEETRAGPSQIFLGYHYHHAETTRSQTFNNELCSAVGCVCFSYQAVCGQSPRKADHASRCDTDAGASGTLQWHRGLASVRECEEMRQQPSVYRDLTCCGTDRCNNQPGKQIKVVEPPNPIPWEDLYGRPHPNAQPDGHDRPAAQPTSSTPAPAPPSWHQPAPHYNPYGQRYPPDPYEAHGHPPSHRQGYDGHVSSSSPSSVYRPAHEYNSHAAPPRPQPPAQASYHQQAHQSSSSLPTTLQRQSSRSRRPTTTTPSDTHKPSEANDVSLQRNTSLSTYSVSMWLVLLSLSNIARSL